MEEFSRYEQESIKTPILAPIIGIIVAVIIFLVALFAPTSMEPPRDGGSSEVQSASTK